MEKMRKIYVLLLMTVSSLGIYAQREYLPILQESMTWTLSHELTGDPPEEYRGVQLYSKHMLKGDTIFDGIPFKQLYAKEWQIKQEEPSGWKMKDYWIGEKDSKIYLRMLDIDMVNVESQYKIYPLVDFTMNVGDILSPKDESLWPKLLVTSASDTIIESSIGKTPRKYIKMSYITESGSVLDWHTEEWIEGIGSYHYGVNGFLREAAGTIPKLIKCIEGETVLYESRDTGNTTDISRSAVQDKVKGTSFYDLQGRRLAAPPTKGVYIQNGRKYVVK